MKTKFTSGPWLITTDKFSVTNHDGKIAEVDAKAAPLDEAVANTKLIAAAPDLYDALESGCMDCLGRKAKDNPCESCYVGKVLRKARGEDGSELEE